MTFDNIVATRRAFSVRRAQLIQDFVEAHRYHVADSIAHWARRLEEANDAEMAFTRLIEGVR